MTRPPRLLLDDVTALPPSLPREARLSVTRRAWCCRRGGGCLREPIRGDRRGKGRGQGPGEERKRPGKTGKCSFGSLNRKTGMWMLETLI
ncbi:Hypothetical predicted protein [Podarcis lilfordi]|uniref:Uncharacterized protein n=1 Tax=Podarcis lilfordi TaxID=74358 RepID=A0AA35PBW9_9SAUR|nr:Hypothetical predicted protein [Podarcis lilfordi]